MNIRKITVAVVFAVLAMSMAGADVARAASALPAGECDASLPSTVSSGFSGGGTCFASDPANPGTTGLQTSALGSYFAYIIPAGTTTSTYIGARVQPGQTGALDLYGTCRYVNVAQGYPSIFVPFKTKAEWLSFVSSFDGAGRNGVTLMHCAPQENLVIPALNPTCANTAFSMPYAAVDPNTTAGTYMYTPNPNFNTIPGPIQMTCGQIYLKNVQTGETILGPYLIEDFYAIFKAGDTAASPPTDWSLYFGPYPQNGQVYPYYTDRFTSPCAPNQQITPDYMTELTACSATCGGVGQQSFKFTDTCGVTYTTTLWCRAAQC